MNIEKIAENRGVLIRDYNAPNWFTPRGVLLKRKEIEKKGIPDLSNCKFITLTIDQRKHSDRQQAYELGKDRLRRFLAKLRLVLGSDLPFAWKLEFHENGFAHWHLIIVYRHFIPLATIQQFNDWWRLGRVHTTRITKDDFDYLFKYVSKGVWGETNEDGINLPDWVLDYCKIDENGRPSSTIRFWQTGGGFYEQKPDSGIDRTKEDKEQTYSRVSYPLRLQIQIWSRKVTFFALDVYGNIRASHHVVLKLPWANFFQCMVHKLIEMQAAFIDGIWICRSYRLESILNTWQMNQIELMELRRSSPGMA